MRFTSYLGQMDALHPVVAHASFLGEEFSLIPTQIENQTFTRLLHHVETWLLRLTANAINQTLFSRDQQTSNYRVIGYPALALRAATCIDHVYVFDWLVAQHYKSLYTWLQARLFYTHQSACMEKPTLASQSVRPIQTRHRGSRQPISPSMHPLMRLIKHYFQTNVFVHRGYKIHHYLINQTNPNISVILAIK